MSGASRIAVREADQARRIGAAENNPKRRALATGDRILDERLECPLGRLAFRGLISQAEYDAGLRWQQTYVSYLACIGATAPFAPAIPLDPGEALSQGQLEMPSDEECEFWTDKFKKGKNLLMSKGKRVFHAVNAVAVYEESEDLGDFSFIAAAAKIGLAALAEGR